MSVSTVLISFYHQNNVLAQVQYFRFKMYTRRFLSGNKTVTVTKCNYFTDNTKLAITTKVPLCNYEEIKNKTGKPYAHLNFSWGFIF